MSMKTLIVLFAIVMGCETNSGFDEESTDTYQDGGAQVATTSSSLLQNFQPGIVTHQINPSKLEAIQKDSISQKTVTGEGDNFSIENTNEPLHAEMNPSVLNHDKISAAEDNLAETDDFISRNLSSPYWDKYSGTNKIYYKETGGNVGIGVANSMALLHVRTADTNAFLDTGYDTAIVEGGEGRLQLAASDSGSHGASLVFSNYYSSSSTRNWIIDQLTSGNGNKLSFRYGTTSEDGDAVSGTKEVASFDFSQYGPALRIRKSQDGGGVCTYTAMKSDPMVDEGSTCNGCDTKLIETQDVNQYIWTPSSGWGIFWAGNSNACFKTDDHPSNPNEIVFVGGGNKKATISLADGDARFNEITASEVTVQPNYWSDYVFKEDYKLASLDEVEGYIKKNGHLPDVPSEEQVKKDGISIGRSQADLLRKIEELTLYVIDLKKEINKLKENN